MRFIAHVLNLFCLEFGAWTLCANAMALLHGSLNLLLGVALPVLALVAFLYLRFHRKFEDFGAERDAEESQTVEAPLPLEPWAAGLGIVLLVASVLFMGKGTFFGLWAVALVGFAFLVWTNLKTKKIRPAALASPPGRASPPTTGPLPGRGGSLRPTVIWLVALLAAALALASHRPDIDDAYYINLAVGAADSPTQPILKNSALYDLPDIPISLRPYRFHSIELLGGALSYVTGLPAIDFFHYLLVALGAVLFILAYGRLFSLVQRGQAALAVILVLVVLLFLDGPHRSYGNFGLVRLFQGKAVYATAIVPLILFAALHFSLRPTLARWFLLLAAEVCGLGMTSSSLYVTPLVVAISLLAGCPSFNKKNLIVLGAGLTSLFYLAGITIYLWISAPLAGRPPLLARNPDGLTYLGNNITTVFGQGRLLVVAAAVFLLAWLFFPVGLGRRLALAAPFVFLLTVLNPLLVPFFARLEPFEFWRFFWAFPLPFLMVGVILYPFHFRGRLPGWAAWTASGLLLVLFLLAGGSFVLLPSNGVRMGIPSLKVDAYYDLAFRLARSVPSRSLVLAPDPVNIWLGTVQPHVFPLRVRGYEFEGIRARYGSQEVWWREFMVSYVDGISHRPQDRDLFGQGLKRYRLAAVCLPHDLAWRTEAAGLLLENGFVLGRSFRRHDIWLREARLPAAVPRN